jgi:hypothetical protein
MTITPVDGVFTVKRKDRYTLAAGDDQTVALPEKPNTALPIRYARSPPPNLSRGSGRAVRENVSAAALPLP